MTDKKKPVETVRYLNNDAAYKDHCSTLVGEGYTLVSAHCSADIDGNEYWLAIFVLPKALERIELSLSEPSLSPDFEAKLASALKEVERWAG